MLANPESLPEDYDYEMMKVSPEKAALNCQILVNNSGKREVLADDTGVGVWNCYAED